jgi:DNA-directed RNA polymerase specialized sigma subunit
MRNKRISLTVENDKLLYNYMKKAKSSGGNLEKAKKLVHSVITEQLNDNQANMVNMYYFDNLKQVDIAERLNINQSTVSRTLARAKNKLAKFLKYLI